MLVSDRVLKLEGNKTNYVLCSLWKTGFKIGYFVTADGLNSNQVSQKVIMNTSLELSFDTVQSSCISYV